MRTVKIVIPCLILVGILSYIYIRASSPMIAIPEIIEKPVPTSPSPLAEAGPLENEGENNLAADTISPLPLANTVTATAILSPTASIDAPELPTAQADTLVETPILTFEVVQSFPHDPQAFTQGLIWLDNLFYEGTGLRGHSSLRQVERDSGNVRKQINLPEQYFGEGITILGDKLYQLTWQSHIGFIYDKDTFEKLAEFSYPTEGWGITHDGERLIMSDGTATLYIWDPETLAEIGQIAVTDQGYPVMQLNELEYIDGKIYANIWQTNRIAVIDPATGNVSAWIDLTGLLALQDRSGTEDVLNGIAYDAETDRLYVTGKLWPKLFEIRLVESR